MKMLRVSVQENKIKVSQNANDTLYHSYPRWLKRIFNVLLQVLEYFKAISGNILCPSSPQTDDSSLVLRDR